MSGGVDSSVAALLAQKAGYEVVGATMRLWNAADDKHRSGCCSLDDVSDAAAVCRRLGIRHYVFNFSEVFKREVADYFVAEYLAGRTPNPCVVCNETIKFGALVDKAVSLGFDYLVTGHYARTSFVGRGKNKTLLLTKAADHSRDQTYFLWRVPPLRLASAMFPIGGLKKSAVRRIALDAGLSVAEKKESRDACFAGGDYKEFLAGVCRRGFPSGAKSAPSAGDIVDENGQVLGRHEGIFRFTVGQRSGAGLAARERLYVLNIDPSSRRVTVGPRPSALSKTFSVGDWLMHAPCEILPAEYGIKIRYLSSEIKGRVSRRGDNLEVELDTSAFGVTPGQSAVFYSGDKIVGGGIISGAGK